MMKKDIYKLIIRGIDGNLRDIIMPLNDSEIPPDRDGVEFMEGDELFDIVCPEEIMDALWRTSCVREMNNIILEHMGR